MKSVVINSDESIGFIEDYKGHTLLNVREWDPGTAVKPEGVYVLEFSDEPVEPQTAEADWAKIKIQKENNKALMRQQVLCWLFGPESDGGE